jgi:hypothetical protein
VPQAKQKKKKADSSYEEIKVELMDDKLATPVLGLGDDLD